MVAAYLVLILIFSSLSISLSKSFKNNENHSYEHKGIPISIKFNSMLNIKVESDDTDLDDGVEIPPFDGVVNIKGKNTSQKTLNGSETSYSKIACFDYSTICRTLVGTSKIPQCYGIEDNTGKQPPKSCREIYNNGIRETGAYLIQPRASNKSVTVLCDMETRGGGWTYIQKRYDGSQDFYLGWRDYKFGFGDLKGEFWLGLENIHLITGFETNELLIELVDAGNKQAYAKYEAFEIGAENKGYPLNTLRGYKGDAGDDMLPHLGQKFTTKDFDQDGNPQNCAVLFSGAWWYFSCHASNLNGQYWTGPNPTGYKARGVHWLSFKGHEESLAATRMMVRPVVT